MPLPITIPPFEIFDEATSSFIVQEEPVKLKLENSLYAIAQWESKYKKPWFPKKKINPYQSEADYQKEIQHTPEEMNYFIKCMVLGMDADDVDDKYIIGMGEENFQKIFNYLQDTQSATKLPPQKEDKKKKNDRVLTSEVLYAYIAESQLSFETQYWNINRLLNCIGIISEDNTPEDKKKKKRQQYERMREWEEINKQRQQTLGTKG